MQDFPVVYDDKHMTIRVQPEGLTSLKRLTDSCNLLLPDKEVGSDKVRWKRVIVQPKQLPRSSGEVVNLRTIYDIYNALGLNLKFPGVEARLLTALGNLKSALDHEALFAGQTLLKRYPRRGLTLKAKLPGGYVLATKPLEVDSSKKSFDFKFVGDVDLVIGHQLMECELKKHCGEDTIPFDWRENNVAAEIQKVFDETMNDYMKHPILVKQFKLLLRTKPAELPLSMYVTVDRWR